MPTWFEDIAGPGYASAIMWTLVALVALGVVMILVKIVRKVSSGSFASSGNQRSRLAVMDAAEVDAQRRLVLVRRDEVEHLIMIGGPTDIVIEQNITGPGRSTPVQTQVAPTIERVPEPVRVAPVAPMAPVVEREPRAVPVQQRPAPAVVERSEPMIAERRVPAAPVAAPIAPIRAERSEPAIADRVAATDPTVDETMVLEFERDFRATDEPAPQRREPSIEDEMDRLLNEAPRERH